MYSIEFCRAPSRYWVGVIDYNGGHVFVSGRTLEDLLKHGKGRMNGEYKISRTQVFLSTHQLDYAEFFRKYGVFMHPIFLGKYWREKRAPEPIVKPVSEPQQPIVSQEKKPAPEIHKQAEYITRKDGEYIVVYELREVAKYKLFEKDE